METRLKALLNTAQPNAVAFGGVGISNNPVRWCGTEGGDPPGYPEIWATDCGEGYGSGCPSNSTNAVWNPSGVDFTLQQGDHWFYTPGDSLHSLNDLIDVYHKSVGANAKLEIDFAISRSGQLAPNHVAAYSAFGAWITSCYGTPLARTIPQPGATSVILSLGSTTVVVDRVAMQEDLSYSQLVNGYTVEYLASNGSWTLFSSGITIGSKRIDVIATPVSTTELRLTIDASFASPHLSSFAAFSPTGCTPPQTRVRFENGGQCLITNSTFPCSGGASNSCPVFLGDCSDPSSVWDDSQGVLQNVLNAPSQINIDCNSETPHTVAKLLQAGGNGIAFFNGQLTWQGTALCLNGGQGPLIPPCNSGEPHADFQIQIDDCTSVTTMGWTRVKV